MIPILYEKTAVNFDNNGIGHLRDTVSLKATEERNGIFEITFTYPISGLWYDEIKEGSIVKAKVNETSELQLFRIYKSSKPLKGIVTFYAKHISYDLSGYPIRSLSLSSTTAEAALSRGFATSLLPHRFTAWSNITTLNDIEITKPRSLRNLCGGEEGSVLSVWRGEFEFDNFKVKLHAARGQDRDVVVSYGKNLTDAKQERNINDCYTHFYPYAVKKYEALDELGEYTMIEEAVTLSDGPIELINPENIGHQKTLTLDISDEFAVDEEINEQSLRAHADAYIASHDLGKPKINITVSFLQIWDSPEYSSFAPLERVSLCDTVTVRFADLGIDAWAKVIKTEYDGLAERYTKIELGDVKESITDTFISLENQVLEATTQIGQTGKTVARLTIQTNELEGRVEALATWVSDNNNAVQSIASISAVANANAAAITSLTKWQDDTNKNIAKIEQTADDASAAIGLVVENNKVKGSVLVEAINGQSTVKISADKVNLTGYVTATSLASNGTTVIDGSRITTGQIASKNYKAGQSGAMLDLENGIVDITSGSNIAGWTTTSSIFGKSVASTIPGSAYVVGFNSLKVGTTGNVIAIGFTPSYSSPLTYWDAATASAPFRVTGEGKVYMKGGNIVDGEIRMTITDALYPGEMTIDGGGLMLRGDSGDYWHYFTHSGLHISGDDSIHISPSDISFTKRSSGVEATLMSVTVGNTTYTVYLNTSTKTIGVRS